MPHRPRKTSLIVKVAPPREEITFKNEFLLAGGQEFILELHNNSQPQGGSLPQGNGRGQPKITSNIRLCCSR